MKKVCAFILFTLSALLFASLWVQLGGMWHSAWNHKLHHEVASLLCMDLIIPILALAAFVAGVRCLGESQRIKIESDAVGCLISLVPILIACSMIFENEIFFSMFNPKIFPVHPTEVLAHPRGAWVTPRAHALTAGAMMIVGALIWFALRERKDAGKSKESCSSI